MSKRTDPLEQACSIPWERSRPVLSRVDKEKRKSNSGRQRPDGELMFKVRIVPSLFTSSDEHVEYLIRYRHSFTRFLGLGIEDEATSEATALRLGERRNNNGGNNSFGCRNDINVDSEHELILTFAVILANVHGNRVFDELIGSENMDLGLWANSKYRSEDIESVFQVAVYKSHIYEKGHSAQALSDEQQATNRKPSKVRSRVENVFKFAENRNSVGGKYIRAIRLAARG